MHPVRRFLSVASFVAPVAACAGQTQVASRTVVSGNALLRELATEDQASRMEAQVARTDDERRGLVVAELAKGSVLTPEDRANVALVAKTGRTPSLGTIGRTDLDFS